MSVEAIQAREQFAAKRVLEEERRLGVGASLDGQRIYDAFAKTYASPVRIDSGWGDLGPRADWVGCQSDGLRNPFWWPIRP